MESTNLTNNVVKSFTDCIQSHEDKITKLNCRLNTPSTLKQLINAKNVMLKNKSALHLNNRLLYPQAALDIIQDEFNELHKKYDDVIMRINHLINTAQYTQSTPTIQLKLPTKLDTPLARKIFARAIEVGLIEKKGNVYKKKGISKALLTYMLGRIYQNEFPEMELNKLFNESRLRQSLYVLSGNKKPPKGSEIVEELFKEA